MNEYNPDYPPAKTVVMVEEELVEMNQHIEALKAERDALRLEVGEWVEKWEDAGHQLNEVEAEQDALAAQVAALKEVVVELADTADHLAHAGHDWQRLGEMAHSVLKTLPAAAARYLAAENVAQTQQAVDDEIERGGNPHRPSLDVAYKVRADAMDAWRKAKEHG